MKKSLIALAVAGAFAAPAALADVSISGQIDIGIANQSGSGTFMEQAGLIDHSGIKFRVDEDLSDGLKAFVFLDAGFNQHGDSANGGRHGQTTFRNLFSRETYVGISGDFGTVKLGQQLSPQVLAIVLNTPLVGQFYVPRTLLAGSGGWAAPGLLGGESSNVGGWFIPNAISYTTPDIAGWSGTLMITTKSGATDGAVSTPTDNDKFQAAHVWGAIGPVKLNFGWSHRDGNNIFPTAGYGYRSYSAGGTYDLWDDLTLAAGYVNSKDDGADTISSWNIGATYRLPTGTTLYAHYAQSDADGTVPGVSTSAVSVIGKDPSIIGVAAAHALSRSTKVYAIFTRATEGLSSSIGNRGANYGAGPGEGTAYDDRNSTYTVGIAKTF